MALSSELVPAGKLEELLQRYKVPAVSIAVIRPGSQTRRYGSASNETSHVVTQVAGLACVETKTPVYDSTWFEIASLSKTIAAAFMIEYFKTKGKDVHTLVNPLFRELGADFQLRSASGLPKEWAEEVTLGQLVNHTGVGMHYVNGVPLSKPMPSSLELMSGTDEKPAPYGYANLDLTKRPGTKFGYSGGGYLVLEHLLQVMEGKPIAEIMQPFLAASGAAVEQGLSFNLKNAPGKHYCTGYKADGAGPVEDSRLMFPPLAAGALGTAGALAEWLRQLAIAYKEQDGCGCVSHDTAVQMLTPGPDVGSEAFMRACMGYGVFVFEAADPGQPANKWMLHQAANDGFRGLYLVCFDGPDAANGPRGLVMLSSSDNNAMFLNCAVVKHLLQSPEVFSPPLQGLDWSQTKNLEDFSLEGLKQEEIVNLGIKDLVLSAFQKPSIQEPAAKIAKKA
jgi:CubicO group peptidase (beta-lactamase class C family)